MCLSRMARSVAEMLCFLICLASAPALTVGVDCEISSARRIGACDLPANASAASHCASKMKTTTATSVCIHGVFCSNVSAIDRERRVVHDGHRVQSRDLFHPLADGRAISSVKSRASADDVLVDFVMASGENRSFASGLDSSILKASEMVWVEGNAASLCRCLFGPTDNMCLCPAVEDHSGSHPKRAAEVVESESAAAAVCPCLVHLDRPSNLDRDRRYPARLARVV